MKRFAWMDRIHLLLQSEHGSALPLVGLAAFVLLGSAGVAIDMSRVQIVQARMTNSLDAAGLAAGSVANTGDIHAEAVKYFNANFPTSYLGTSVSDISIAATADNSVLTLDVNGTVPTTFMRLFGMNNVPITAHSEITRASKGMELVLVMDVTGSMSSSAGGGLSKIQASKNAATSLVNILYGDDDSIDNLWIGLVPFAQAVNIGSSRGSWTSNPSMPSPGWGPTTWMGCVDAREAGGRDRTDDPPSVALFPKYYWTCHTTNNAWYGTNSSRNNCNTGSGLNYKSGLGVSLGPNKACSQVVTPMNSSKTTILNAIDDMDPQGNTHIVTGAAWGWRMLSPRWRGLWGGEMDADALPQEYNTPLMNKVMILMTDGDNTIDNSNRGAYWYLSDGKLGTTNSTNAVNQLNSRLQTVCTNMKSNDIIIYTIAFGTGISSTAQNMLRNCASKPEYYFFSPSGEALQAAFHMIGDSLANLRISK